MIEYADNAGTFLAYPDKSVMIIQSSQDLNNILTNQLAIII